ncbi:MAG: hypothetical protein HYU52_10105 [Acidobacteria bacterium]|nr:hypothetical protein [Acidobacteriota bacterium]
MEERLQRLEKGFEELKSVNETLLAENASLRKQLDLVASEAKTPVVRPSGKPEKLQFGGFVQVQGEAGDAVASRFADDGDRIFVRRARLSASGNFARHIDYRLESEFAGTLGNSSAMRAQMTDGYVTFTHWPAATIRTGQFKTPFGFEQLVSDTKLATPERSVINDMLTPGRQLGVQLAGDIAGKRLSYALGAFNGNASNTSFNDGDNFMVAARLSALLAGSSGGSKSLRIGVNGYTSEDESVSVSPALGLDSTPATPARDNVFAGTRTGYGIDAQFVAGRTEIWAEYLATDFEPLKGLHSDVSASGWYAQAGYFALPGTIQVVGKYESNDPSDLRTGDDADVFWLGANWFLQSHDIKLQFFYAIDDAESADGSGRVVARVQTVF